MKNTINTALGCLMASALLYAINEMYTREAKALGMDQGDAIIDRRLKQKMDYMLDDIAFHVVV